MSVHPTSVTTVRGLPNDVSQVALSWERGGKMSVASDGRHTEPTGGDDKMATIDTTLSMPATLYRSARRCVYDAKPTIIRVLDLSGGPYATPTVLGTVDFDLSSEVELNEDSPARSKQLQRTAVTCRGLKSSPMRSRAECSRWMPCSRLPPTAAS